MTLWPSQKTGCEVILSLPTLSYSVSQSLFSFFPPTFQLIAFICTLFGFSPPRDDPHNIVMTHLSLPRDDMSHGTCR